MAVSEEKGSLSKAFPVFICIFDILLVLEKKSRKRSVQAEVQVLSVFGSF